MGVPDPAKVDRKYAEAYLSVLLADLGVTQDQSTAEGVLSAAHSVQRKRLQGVGEVIVVTFPTETQPEQPAPASLQSKATYQPNPPNTGGH